MTFDTIADIIAVTCGVLCEHDSSLLNDRGIDSLELLDVAFAIDDAFSITIPVDSWSRWFTWAGFPHLAKLLPSRTTAFPPGSIRSSTIASYVR